jgi:transposase
MISFSSAQRYYLYRQPTDMRKSFDALAALVSGQMTGNVFSGDVFIFINRHRNRIKLLVWDRSGFVICYKRLEEGTFEMPSLKEEEKNLEIKWENLVMILEGIKLESVMRKKRYTRSC